MSIMSPRAPDEDPSIGSGRSRRILFLDDDPARAEIFLAENPDAIWVQTADECIARLAEPWDEVHLDHDLGGERYVDLSRDDCGMAVVRWLCLEPHPHLLETHFLIHSHNAGAACIMLMQIHVAGFRVEHRPFGVTTTLPPPQDPFWNHRPLWHDWLAKFVALARRLIVPRPDPGRISGEPGTPIPREHS
jgi:NAD+-processing family protein with receiver domain